MCAFIQIVDNEKGYQEVQVDEYQPLRSYRSSDGRWRLENNYCVFEQTSSIPSEELPLFDVVTFNASL